MASQKYTDAGVVQMRDYLIVNIFVEAVARVFQ